MCLCEICKSYQKCLQKELFFPPPSTTTPYPVCLIVDAVHGLFPPYPSVIGELEKN